MEIQAGGNNCTPDCAYVVHMSLELHLDQCLTSPQHGLKPKIQQNLETLVLSHEALNCMSAGKCDVLVNHWCTHPRQRSLQLMHHFSPSR